MRNEKPQRGRNREFWQLNCDIFGSNSLNADIEVLRLALDIMLEFDPPQNSFVLAVNSRKLIDELLSVSGAGKLVLEKKMAVIRTLDKWLKLKTEDIESRLSEAGLASESIEIIKIFMKSRCLEDLSSGLPSLSDSEGFKEMAHILKELEESGYGDWIEFNPAVIRGFDYYDGMIFEVFDKHPENNRAMFGGGRYNGLAELFGQNNFPAVGFAPGDEATRLFLESWKLEDKVREGQPEKYYLPILSQKIISNVNELAKKMRGRGFNVLVGLEEQRLTKALEFANKKNINRVLILGEDELAKGVCKIKDMTGGKEEEIAL
jgi:histidyl-tRNA synthetase